MCRRSRAWLCDELFGRPLPVGEAFLGVSLNPYCWSAFQPFVLLFLVRHGETPENVANVFPRGDGSPLTERGLRQAEWAARALSSFRVVEVRSSPALRARQTAEPIARRLGLGVVVDERLGDVGLGSLAGRPRREVGLEHVEDLEEYFGGGPSVYGVEPYSSVLSRLLAAVSDAGRLGGGVVFVTHQAVVRALVAYALGAPPGRWVGGIPVDNASITVFEVFSGRPKLRTLNWVSPELLGVGPAV